jgi:succinate dehydrogenase flavin-adding protein (antitoxin of CptAB toxin-antitoxin module)
MSEFGGASDGLQKDHPDIRRRRLLFRCWHRDTQEIDLLLFVRRGLSRWL